MTYSIPSKRAGALLASAAAAALLLGSSLDAAAQPAQPAQPADAPPADPGDPACPPGAICETTDVGEPPVEPPADAPPDGGTTVVVPPAGGDAGAPRWILVNPDGSTGQVIVYDPNAPPGSMRAAAPPPPREDLDEDEDDEDWDRPWGANLRVEGVMLPRYMHDAEDAGMAGLGFSLRYRPIPYLAVDASIDFAGGLDANGFSRQEVPFGFSAFVYANPRDLAQFYLFGGVDWSIARVRSDAVEPQLAGGTEDEYNYFGGHLGLGVEFRVTPLIGVDLDTLAFVRGRTDDDGEGRYPEFVDPDTGRTSNLSAAGLLRAGVSFWW